MAAGSGPTSCGWSAVSRTDRLCLALRSGVALAVCVPKTSSTSGDQAIFVDQATDASVSSDAVLLKIGRFGQRFQRRGAMQGAVRPVLIVVSFVLAQDLPQMGLVPAEGAVQEFASASADPVGLEYTIVAVTCSLVAALLLQPRGAVRPRSGTRA